MCFVDTYIVRGRHFMSSRPKCSQRCKQLPSPEMHSNVTPASLVQHAVEYTRSPRDATRTFDPKTATITAMTHPVRVCCGRLHSHATRPPALPEQDTEPPLHAVGARKFCHWGTITVLCIPCTRERQWGSLTPGPSRRSAEPSHVRNHASLPRAKQIDHCYAFLAWGSDLTTGDYT